MPDINELEEEILAEMESGKVIVSEPEKVFVIDNDLRTISIPQGIVHIGVENDGDVNRFHFRMPRTFGEFDLGEFDIGINYMNRKKINNVYVPNVYTADKYHVDDKTVDGDNITFSWLTGRNANKYVGDTKFIVCLKKTDSKGNVQKEFNTTVATLNVLEGLETAEQVVQENPDIIEQILKKIETGGAGGANAREIELQKSGTAIQWRYTGDEAWTDLVSLEDIKGEPGTDGKSAYQYAQEGGYTGTEEEFAAKLGRDYIPEYSGKTYEPIDLIDETIFTTNGYYVLSGYFTVGDSEQVQIITPDVFCYSNYPDPGDKARIILNGIYTQYEIVCKNGSTALQITKTDKSVTSVNGYTGDVTLSFATPLVRMTSANTLAEIQPNILYVWPEISELSLTLAAPADTTIVNEYHCIFLSGATATVLSIPDTIKVPDGFVVESNKVYELSILEGCLSYMSWEV